MNNESGMKNHFYRYIPGILMLIIGGTAVILSLSQTIVYFVQTPAGRFYPFVQNYIEDFYYYLSIMRQGWEGQWLATSRLTSEVYPGKFVVVFFLLLGHISRISNLSLPVVYTVARAIGGIGLISLIWWLIKRVYSDSLNKRLLALVFAVFGTAFWSIQNGQIVLDNLVREWTELDPIFRLTFVPHHLWSKVFMVWGFINIYQIITKSNTKTNSRVSQDSNSGPAARVSQGYDTSSLGSPSLASPEYFLRLLRNSLYLKLFLAVSFMGFTNPTALSTFLPVVGVWMVAEIIISLGPVPMLRSWIAHCGIFRNDPGSGITFDPGSLRVAFFVTIPDRIKSIFPFIVALAVGLMVALYHRHIQTSVFPWTSYLPWENSMRYPISAFAYAKSFGPLFILFIIAVPRLLQSTIGRLLVAWAASGWLMLFVFGRFLPLSNIRFLGGYQFIPVGIGAVEGIYILLRPTQNSKVPLRPLSEASKTQKHKSKVKIIFLDRHSRESGNPMNIIIWILRSSRRMTNGVNFNHILQIIIFIMFCIYFSIGIYASWGQQMEYVKINQNNPQVYLEYQLLDVFKYLDSQTESQSIVLAPYFASSMIPAFTGNRVVAGHALMTLNNPEKKQAIEMFYASGDGQIKKRILDSYNISYVLFPKQDLPDDKTLNDLFLGKAYEKGKWVVVKRGK